MKKSTLIFAIVLITAKYLFSQEHLDYCNHQANTPFLVNTSNLNLVKLGINVDPKAYLHIKSGGWQTTPSFISGIYDYDDRLSEILFNYDDTKTKYAIHQKGYGNTYIQNLFENDVKIGGALISSKKSNSCGITLDRDLIRFDFGMTLDETYFQPLSIGAMGIGINLGVKDNSHMLYIGSGYLYNEIFDNSITYLGFNIYRSQKFGTWDMCSNENNNGGGTIYSTIEGDIKFITIPSTGTGGQSLTDNQMLSYRKMIIKSNGNVGIGTMAPNNKLDVYDVANCNISVMSDINAGLWAKTPQSSIALTADRNGKGYISTINSVTPYNQINFVTFWNKNVFIGEDIDLDLFSDDPFKLVVKGKILCTELKVKLASNWPDYVFNTDYKLKSLDEVEKYINETNHLPELPSATYIQENGYYVGEMDAILLKKIEELTLYLIQQKKVIENQQKEINDLKNIVVK